MPIVVRSRKSAGAIHLAAEAAPRRRRLASTSVPAFWLRRIAIGILCRVTDVAANHFLVDAGRRKRAQARFPGMSARSRRALPLPLHEQATRHPRIARLRSASSAIAEFVN
jgi:hypothetical protein